MKAIGFLLIGLTLLTFTIIQAIEENITWVSQHGGSHDMDSYLYIILIVVFLMGLFAYIKGKD